MGCQNRAAISQNEMTVQSRMLLQLRLESPIEMLGDVFDLDQSPSSLPSMEYFRRDHFYCTH
jgi:hypothetical protein